MQTQKHASILIVQRRNLWCLLFFLLVLHHHFLLQHTSTSTSSNTNTNQSKERQSDGVTTYIFVQGSSNSNPLPPPPPNRRPPPPPPPPPPIPFNDQGNDNDDNDDGNSVKKENVNIGGREERTLNSYEDRNSSKGPSFHDDDDDNDESDGLNFGRRRNSAVSASTRRMGSRRTDYYSDNEMDIDTDAKADMSMYSDNDDYYYRGSSLPPSKSRSRPQPQPQQRGTPRRRMVDDIDFDGGRDEYYATYNEATEKGRERERERERPRGRREAPLLREYDDDSYDRGDDDLSYDYRNRRQPSSRLREREQRGDYDDRREKQRLRQQPPLSDPSRRPWDDRDFDRREMSRRREGHMPPDPWQQQGRQQQRQRRGPEEEEVQRERENEDEGKKTKKKSFFSSPFGKAFGTGKSNTAKVKGDNRKDDGNFQKRKKTMPRNAAFRRDKINDDNDRFVNTDIDDQSGGDDEKSYNPIDYLFPTKDISSASSELKRGDVDDSNDSKGGGDLMKLPETGWDDSRRIERYNKGRPMGGSSYANPRRDAIARYTSTKSGKMKLALSSSTCGALLGAFIGKSIFSYGKQTAILFGFMFWFMGTFLRNVYGEMVRSVALGFIFLLSRTRDVRKRYRTGVHLRTICRLGGGGRVPFPPILDEEGVENPWRYVPETDDDPDFDMIKSVICMVLIGSFCGGNIPLIPTWMGSTGGAAAFAFMCIGKNARGDLVRTMGMRVVAIAGEAIDINRELNVARKVAVVAGRLLDKALILDRKHRIKDRVLKGATWAFDKVGSTVKNVQEDMNDEQRPGRGKRQDDRPRETRPTER